VALRVVEEEPDALEMIDPLLEKIGRSGMASLTDKEKARFLADDYVMSTELQKKGIKTLVCNRSDFSRSNGLRIRQEGLGEDALQNNKGTGGNLAAYTLLKNA
jgi:hypothetical protein